MGRVWRTVGLLSGKPTTSERPAHAILADRSLFETMNVDTDAIRDVDPGEGLRRQQVEGIQSQRESA